jgi:hypothetical protein
VSVRCDRGGARATAGDPLRQRAGTDQPAFSGVERQIELVHIQPKKPMQNAHVESFHDGCERKPDRELVSELVRRATEHRGKRTEYNESIRTEVWHTVHAERATAAQAPGF